MTLDIQTAIAAGWSRRHAAKAGAWTGISSSRSGRGGTGCQTLSVPATFDSFSRRASAWSGSRPGIRAAFPAAV